MVVDGSWNERRALLVAAERFHDPGNRTRHRGVAARPEYVVAADLPPQRRRTTPLPVGITMAVLHIMQCTNLGAWSEFRMA